jgi:hypothetical protein
MVLVMVFARRRLVLRESRPTVEVVARRRRIGVE